MYSLRQALTDAKYKLRDIATGALEGAEITGDLTNDNIAQGLAKMGASQKVQDYYTEAVDGKAPTISDYIRRSSLFEQARDMGNQIEAEKYTRSASKAPSNPITKIWNASGLDQPVNTLLRTAVAPIAGKLTDVAGGLVKGAGDLYAKATQPSGTQTIGTETKTVSTDYNPATQVYNAIGRTTGEIEGENAASGYLNAANQASEPTTLDDLASNASPASSTSVYNSLYGNNYTSGDYYSNLLQRAMNMAMEDGNANAFASLLSMYNDYSQKNSSNTSQTKLTDKQRQANAAERALNDFEATDSNFAYDVSDIPIIGTIANWGGNEYASKAEALALQIGYMLSGATVNKEEAKNIGMAYVPQPRDSEAVRQSKLRQLRGIIADYQQTYGE